MQTPSAGFPAPGRIKQDPHGHPGVTRRRPAEFLDWGGHRGAPATHRTSPHAKQPWHLPHRCPRTAAGVNDTTREGMQVSLSGPVSAGDGTRGDDRVPDRPRAGGRPHPLRTTSLVAARSTTTGLPNAPGERLPCQIPRRITRHEGGKGSQPSTLVGPVKETGGGAYISPWGSERPGDELVCQPEKPPMHIE